MYNCFLEDWLGRGIGGGGGGRGGDEEGMRRSGLLYWRWGN